MRQKRIGQDLWQEWEGDFFSPELNDPIIFFTDDWVDLESDVVFSGLAFAVQQSGISSSLAHAKRMIEKSKTHRGYAGFYGGSTELTWHKDELLPHDEIDYDTFINDRPITIVEFEHGD